MNDSFIWNNKRILPIFRFPLIVSTNFIVYWNQMQIKSFQLGRKQMDGLNCNPMLHHELLLYC